MFGPWRPTGILGSGGDAIVHAAEDPWTGRAVAIKALHPGGSVQRAARLEREYQYLRSLRLPFLPAVRGFGRDLSGLPWLAMDRIFGDAPHDFVTAHAIHGTERFTVVALACTLRAAALVAELQAWGLMHGDLKPGAFLVGEDGRMWLLDLGASLPMRTEALTAPTREGLATPPYAAPERLETRALVPATDTWSLGAVAVRLLTGHHPFGRGTRADMRARLHTPDLGAVAAKLGALPGMTPALVGALMLAFERDPAQRPTPAAWFEALRAAGAPDDPMAFATMNPAPEVDFPTESRAAPLVVALAAIAARVPWQAVADRMRCSMPEIEWQATAAATWLDASPDGLCATPAAFQHVAGLLTPDQFRAEQAAWVDALSLQPLGPARILALLAAGRFSEATEALERFATIALAGGGLGAGVALDDAWMAAGGSDGPSALTLRWTIAAARFSCADHSRAAPVFARLDALARREPLHGPLIGRTRWALARHLGTFDADGAPISLGLAWRSWLVGDSAAAVSAAAAAAHEARALRQTAAEADALLLQSHLALMGGQPASALEHACAALERTSPTEPGHGEVLAQVARLRLLGGAWSAAGALIATPPILATPIDRAHLLVLRAELSLLLDHPEVALESLDSAFSAAAVDGLPPTQPLRATFHALRLEAELALGRTPDLTAPSLLLADLARLGLRAILPRLATALAVARHAAHDADGATHALRLGLEAASGLGDVPQILGCATASALCGLTCDPALTTSATAIAAQHGLVTPLLALARARADEPLAARHATHILAQCHGIEAAALALAPWYVAATHRDSTLAAS
jgi:hypothetical protein